MAPQCESPCFSLQSDFNTPEGLTLAAFRRLQNTSTPTSPTPPPVPQSLRDVTFCMPHQQHLAACTEELYFSDSDDDVTSSSSGDDEDWEIPYAPKRTGHRLVDAWTDEEDSEDDSNADDEVTEQPLARALFRDCTYILAPADSILHTQFKLTNSQDSVTPSAKSALTCPYNTCRLQLADVCRLRTHLREAHGEQQPLPYRCGRCSARFKYALQLNTHRATHDQLRFTCRYRACAQAFRTEAELSSHLLKQHMPKSTVARRQTTYDVSRRQASVSMLKQPSLDSRIPKPVGQPTRLAISRRMSLLPVPVSRKFAS